MQNYNIGQKVMVKGSEDIRVVSGFRNGRYSLDEGVYWWRDDELEPLEKTWETLEALDMLVDKNGDKSIVISVVGEIVVRTNLWDGLGRGNVMYQTISSIKKEGWTIKGATESVTELTLDQIADKFNLPVSQIKIKK